MGRLPALLVGHLSVMKMFTRNSSERGVLKLFCVLAVDFLGFFSDCLAISSEFFWKFATTGLEFS